MCKAKPGPRCSADTYKVLVASYQRIQTVQQELLQLENLNVTGSHTTQVDSKKRALEKEKQTYARDYAMFYATKTGFKTLQNKIDELAGKTVTVREGTLMEDGDWGDASYKEYASWKENNLLERAKIHRQWQTSTAKILTEIETTSPEIAINKSYELRESLAANIQNIRRLLENQKNNQQKLIQEVIYTRKSPDSIEKLRHSARTIHAFETYITYANIEFNDLKDYEDNVRKRTGVLV